MQSPEGPAVVQGRKKSRRACEACRSRKRKCDGKYPCNLCRRFEYECSYEEKRPRKPRRPPNVQEINGIGKDSAASIATVSMGDGKSTVDSEPRSLISQQGSPNGPDKPVFVATDLVERFPQFQVLDELNPDKHQPSHSKGQNGLPTANSNHTNKPRRLHDYSWSVGIRSSKATALIPFSARPDLLPAACLQHELTSGGLADTYFAKVHPIYTVVCRQTFSRHLQSLWPGTSPRLSSSDSYTPVLCGVAALGSLFATQPSPYEDEFVEDARRVLEMTSVEEPLDLNHVTGWILRTLYLRLGRSPHAVWMASCSTIHAVEAVGLHRRHTGGVDEAAVRARLYFIARLLHNWICNEYGRSRVDLVGVTVMPPAPPPSPTSSSADNLETDHCATLIQIFLLSAPLVDLSTPTTAADLHAAIASFSTIHAATTHDVLTLHTANNVFCLYRRLRLICSSSSSFSSSDHHNNTLAQILQMGTDGCAAAERCARRREPWWHVLNVPFMFLCVLLAMDTRESLRQVRGAMRTLRAVAACFETQQMRRAVGMAEVLVGLCRRRHEEDAGMLEGALQTPLEEGGRLDPDDSSDGEEAMVSGASFDARNAASAVVPNKHHQYHQKQKQQQSPVSAPIPNDTPPPAIDVLDPFTIDLENFEWDLFLNSDYLLPSS